MLIEGNVDNGAVEGIDQDEATGLPSGRMIMPEFEPLSVVARRFNCSRSKVTRLVLLGLVRVNRKPHLPPKYSVEDVRQALEGVAEATSPSV